MSKERDQLIRSTKEARFAIEFDKISSKIINIIIILAIIFIVASIADMLKFTMKGVNGVKFHDFGELLGINPDTVAWIKMDGTHINNPVVKGKDNFVYLDMDFYGDYYAGGTLFLDYKNSKDFSDDYNIIHGHHMVGGAMFGDLSKYLKKDFLNEHTTGVLLTPTQNYRLKVFGAGTVNAYDLRLYNVKANKVMHYTEIEKKMKQKNDTVYKNKKIVVLSTCTGDLNDNRTVVFCIAEPDSSIENVT